jgi:hypothetical protein
MCICMIGLSVIVRWAMDDRSLAREPRSATSEGGEEVGAWGDGWVGVGVGGGE